MPLTKTEGLFLSNDELLGGLLENESPRQQLAGKLPFYSVCGHSLLVQRVSSANFGVAPQFDTVPVAVTEGVAVPSSPTQVSYEVKSIVQDVFAADFTAINQSNVNNQVDVQINAALMRMLYKFWETFYKGDTSVNAEEFSGIRKLTPSGRTLLPVDTVNYFLQRIDLARLIATMTASAGRTDVLLTSPLGYRNIQNILANGGMTGGYGAGVPLMSLPTLGSVVGGSRGQSGPSSMSGLSFMGIPILVNENVETTEGIASFSDATSVYALKLGENGLCGIVAGCNDSSMVNIRHRMVAGTSQTAYRLSWSVGLALKSEDAIARMPFRISPGSP